MHNVRCPHIYKEREGIKNNQCLKTDSKFYYPVPRNLSTHEGWEPYEVEIFDAQIKEHGTDYEKLCSMLPNKSKERIMRKVNKYRSIIKHNPGRLS